MMFVFFSEESAMGEPAWSGAGESVSLKIWRVVVRLYISKEQKLNTCNYRIIFDNLTD